MWRNYLTVGLRALSRNRVHAFINIFGLAVGLAGCLLLLLYVRYETRYDSWLADSERLFQVQATWHETGQPITRSQHSPMPLRDTLAAGFPEIEALSVAMPDRVLTTREGQPVYLDALSVDPAFFDIFKLDFVRGSARNALPNVSSVVLTEREAIRQFGTTDVLGRTITETGEDGKRDYRVTAVLRDLPRNSHLELAALFRYDPHAFDDVPASFKGWGSMNQLHYAKLRSPADAASINARLPAWEKRTIPPQLVDGRQMSQADILDLALVNVADVHLGAAQQGALTPGNDPKTVATFGIVAALILAMACINFVNLSTARAGQRAREVALRKVLGASRSQLIVQFLGESLLLVGIAMVIALAFVELSAGWLGRWLEVDLAVSYLGAGGIALPVVALVLIVAAAGGLYPAFYLSRFQPAQVLKANKSTAETPGTGRLRNLLVVSQFAVSIGLIICTAIIYSQTRFVQTVDPGFRRDGLIQISNARRLTRSENYQAFRNEALKLPGVSGVARTNLGIAATNKSIIVVKHPGAPTNTDMGFYRGDADYLGTMGMRLLAGRMLTESQAKDRVGHPGEAGEPAGPSLVDRGVIVVINRRAAAQLGFRAPAAAIGKTIQVGIDGDELVPSTIVGVVEDTRIRSARDEIEPLVLGMDPSRTGQILVRYHNAVPSQVIAALGALWSRIVPDLPFDGAFAEDIVAEQYRQEQARSAIFLGFALLAVIIACLGLFGLAAYTTERRTKEIGIRKVLGARIRDIVQLLTWQFSKPVVIANLVAWPIAWWAMRDWLNTFDVRIALTPGPFLLAGLLALAVAIGTVAGHALRVARLNPIHALRYE